MIGYQKTNPTNPNEAIRQPRNPRLIN